MRIIIPVIQHTVDCLQTIGVCEQRTIRLFSIDRMFVIKRPDVFFNQPDVLKSIKLLFIQSFSL